ncbi:MAG: two-component system, OmpR family, sensor histidine kinase MtrB [Cryptosporangiaceae bacterium]|nr:two-component system, OmpR family, sensor histidine kinase MtrB [Cryptosporangiaceae bacterium]
MGGEATPLGGRATAAGGWATALPGLGLSRVPLKPLRTGHLRRRLTVAFVLVAATAAAVLGASSYVLVRNARLQDSLDRAAQDARFQLLLSRQFVPVPAKREDLLASFESTGHHVVLVSGTERAASDPDYDPAIPARLRATAAAGGLGYARVSDAGRALLLVGGRVPGTSAQLYTVAAEDTVRADLGQLRNVILASWAAVVLLAAMIGHVLARRILDPVARAGATARSVAEDLLGSPPATGPSDEFGSWVATFHQLATALRERTAALGEARDRERRFAAGVAHELLDPVSELASSAAALDGHLDSLPERVRRPVQQLATDVSRLRALAGGLAEIARLDAGGELVREVPVRLEALVREVVAAHGWLGVQVLVLSRGAAGPEDVELWTDPQRAGRILETLIGNALEHGGAEVRVTLERAGDSIRVLVSDRGPGIAPEHIPHLFSRFYKADPAHADGTGLGLAIARAHTSLLGGELHVRSEVGIGTEFQLALPVSNPALRPRRDGEPRTEAIR